MPGRDFPLKIGQFRIRWTEVRPMLRRRAASVCGRRHGEVAGLQKSARPRSLAGGLIALRGGEFKLHEFAGFGEGGRHRRPTSGAVPKTEVAPGESAADSG